MKVQTNLKAGQIVVAVGSAAITFSYNSQSATGGGAANTFNLTQSAASTNSGAVTATAPVT